jgi:hypothetical protein
MSVGFCRGRPFSGVGETPIVLSERPKVNGYGQG